MRDCRQVLTRMFGMVLQREGLSEASFECSRRLLKDNMNTNKTKVIEISRQKVALGRKEETIKFRKLATAGLRMHNYHFLIGP